MGLSIDILMEYGEDNEWNEDEIKVNMLSNDNIINEGKLEFMKLFQIIKKNVQTQNLNHYLIIIHCQSFKHLYY